MIGCTLFTKPKPNFLYAIVAATNSGTSVPIFQFISEAHDSETISGRLKNWTKDLPKPKEVVIDCSAALLLSLITTYTQFGTTKEYLNACHSILTGSENTIPYIFIRHDVAHFIKILRTNKIFEKVGNPIKTFYLNAIGLLFWAKDFDLIKTIVEDILVLCMCKYEFEENQQRLTTAKTTLFQLIQTHKPAKLYTYEENEEIEENEKNQDENDGKDHETIQENYTFWYDEMKKKILIFTSDEDQELDIPNMYYFPNFEPFFRKIIYSLPLWGAAMVLTFNSPNLNVSSANVESSFRYIKNNLFRLNKKQRADTFVLSHINDLIGSTKIATANLNNHRLALEHTSSNTKPADRQTLNGKNIEIKTKKSKTTIKIGASSNVNQETFITTNKGN